MKLFTSMVMAVVLLTAAKVNAQTIQRAGAIEYYSYTDGVDKPTAPSSTTNQFFDKDGNMVIEISSPYMYMYTYNSNGSTASRTSYYYNSTTGIWEYGAKTSYVYDSEGNLTRLNNLNEEGTVTDYTDYEEYINGKYTYMTNKSADGTATYWNKLEYTFSDGLPTEAIQYYKGSEEGDWTISAKNVYTYSNGNLISDTYYYYNSGTYTESSTIDYTYSNGNLSTKTSSYSWSGTTYLSEYDYIYNDYSADYEATNLSLSNGTEANSVILNWTAATSSNVTGYMIFVDDLLEGIVNGTTYTTSSLINGEHAFAVVAVVNDATSTISDVLMYTVEDEGVIPPTNLRAVSIGTLDETNATYDIELAWDAPVTSSTISSYTITYGGYYTVTVDANTTSTTVTISSWMTEATDWTTYETYAVDVDFNVSANYTTGTSDASNTISVNFQEGASSTGIDAIDFEEVKVYPNPATDYIHFSEEVTVKIYSLTGNIVSTSFNYVDGLDISDLATGIYIVETTTFNGFKSQTKLIIK